MVFILLVIVIMIIFSIVISIVYTIEYIYDFIFRNILVKCVKFIDKKNLCIGASSVIKILRKSNQSKKLYLRYETPIFTFYFSWFPIMLLTHVLPVKECLGMIISSFIYVVLYLGGMFRRTSCLKKQYERILNNNIEFLSISYKPFGFIITIFGFYFTITGKNIHELFNFFSIENLFIKIVNEYSGNIFIEFFVLIFLSIIISLPVQVMSYYLILIIKYFYKYKIEHVTFVRKLIKLLF